MKGRDLVHCLWAFEPSLMPTVMQGESIEEAVRREVFEESGVRVGEVAILGSQPWPIGRGGSCELMVGCIAKAVDSSLAMDEDEMDDVRSASPVARSGMAGGSQ